VVERSFAWLHQYRRLRVRYERRADIHEALLTIGCCLICFKQLQAAESLRKGFLEVRPSLRPSDHPTRAPYSGLER
jgi:hypothetical protein